MFILLAFHTLLLFNTFIDKLVALLVIVATSALEVVTTFNVVRGPTWLDIRVFGPVAEVIDDSIFPLITISLTFSSSTIKPSWALIVFN